MSTRSKQLQRAYEIRDQVAALVTGFEAQYPGLRLMILQECEQDISPTETRCGRAKVNSLAVEIVARDGVAKKTNHLELSL